MLQTRQWCSQQQHERILHNPQIGGECLENADPAPTDQSIGIDRSVCSAIKLSPGRGIHQCSKQGSGALNNDTKGSCTIDRLGVDALRMLIRLLQTNRSGSIDCSAIKLSPARGIHQCSKHIIHWYKYQLRAHDIPKWLICIEKKTRCFLCFCFEA